MNKLHSVTEICGAPGVRSLPLCFAMAVLTTVVAKGNPIVVGPDRLEDRHRSASSTMGATLSTSFDSPGVHTMGNSWGQLDTYSYSESIPYRSTSGSLVHDSGLRTVGVTAFGGTDSSYGNGNRYLPTTGYHLVGEQDNKVSKRTVKCPTCGGDGIVRNWWGGRETCENCKGEGLSVKCSNCDSTGRVWRWWAGNTDCPECSGKKGGDGK